MVYYVNEEAENYLKMRRKFFCYILCMMAGILFGTLMEDKRMHSAILALPFFYAFQRKKEKCTRICTGFFAFGLILFLFFHFQFTNGSCHTPSGQPVECRVTGLITDVEVKEEEKLCFTIEVRGEKMLASYYQKLRTPWKLIGHHISFSAEIGRPAEAGNPRTFDYRRYLLSQGIEYICTIDSFTVETKRASPFFCAKRWIMEKREMFLQKLTLGEKEKGVLRGVLFGDKNQMEEDLYHAFRQNGTAHVLAVSGLHVAMLYRIYRWLYEKWKSHWLTAGFLGFLFVYGTASLWAVSVTRAVGLILLGILGTTIDRRYDLLTALACMAMFSMVRNPYVIFDAGFQMSFLAVLSITFLQRSFVKYVGQRWAVPLAVQSGLLPYMAYTFHYVSLVGIICNIPVIFLTSVLVPAGIGGFTAFLAFGEIIPGLSQMLDGVTQMMIWCNNLFVADGFLSFDVISPPLWLIILVYGVVFFLSSEYFYIYFHRREWKKLTVPLLLIIICTATGFWADYTPFDKAELVFVDVGQGDCLHVKTKSGTQVLIDGGGKFGYNTGEKTLKPYLLKNRIRKIDLAAATHLHTDHFAGLQELAACYPVKQLITEGQAGQKIVLEENYWLEILWPQRKNPDTDDENRNSLIFMVHHNGLRTLVTGDITSEGEAMLLAAYKGTDRLRADILKIAHHGSAYSTSDPFLKAVNPRAAVISVGKNNYGHPSEIVIEKLEENGIMVFRTDQHGAVGIINSKGNLSICTEKQR